MSICLQVVIGLFVGPLSNEVKKHIGYWISIHSYCSNIDKINAPNTNTLSDLLIELDEKSRSKMASTASIQGAKYYKYINICMNEAYGKNAKIKIYDYIIQIQMKHDIVQSINSIHCNGFNVPIKFKKFEFKLLTFG